MARWSGCLRPSIPEKAQGTQGLGPRHLLRSLRPCSRALSRTRSIRRCRERQRSLAKEFRLCSCERQPARMEDSERIVQSSSIEFRWEMETDESAWISLDSHALCRGRTVGWMSRQSKCAQAKVSGERKAV